MTTSVALAICFPYQGTEPYLRVKTDDAGGTNNAGAMDAVAVDNTVLEETVVLEDNSIDADVMVIKQNNEMSTTDQEVVSSSPLQTIDVAEASAPSVAKDGGDGTSNNSSNGGLFSSSATATDEQPTNSASSEQTDAATSGAKADSDNNSCQMKLRLADANLDYIIDASEYITFLQHFVGDIPLGTTQFDELESEYQVNFDHLAMAHTSNNGGEDNDTNGVVGIPIATLEEMQKVCVYISNMGSSAVGEFDWDSISSSP